MCNPIGKIAEVTQRWKAAYIKNGFGINEKEANAIAKCVDKRFYVKAFKISDKAVVTGSYRELVTFEFGDLFKKMEKEFKNYEYCGTYQFTPIIHQKEGDHAEMEFDIYLKALLNPRNLCIGCTFRPKKRVYGFPTEHTVIVALAKKDLFEEAKHSRYKLRKFRYFINEDEVKTAKKRREQIGSIPKFGSSLDQIFMFMCKVSKPGFLKLNPSKIAHMLRNSNSMGLVRLDRNARKYKSWMSRYRKAVVLIEGGRGFSVKEGWHFVGEELPRFEKMVCQMRQKSTNRRCFEAQVLLMNERNEYEKTGRKG